MAYEKIKPAIRALQLCHRFGKGPKVISRDETRHTFDSELTFQVLLAKLPQELLDITIGFLFDEEKPKHIDTWQRPKACYDGDCCARDHYTEAEIEEMREDVAGNFWMGVDDDEELDDLIDEQVDELLCDMEWLDRCEERKELWEELTYLVCSIIIMAWTVLILCDHATEFHGHSQRVQA
jgi:hypothetical protein